MCQHDMFPSPPAIGTFVAIWYIVGTLHLDCWGVIVAIVIKVKRVYADTVKKKQTMGDCTTQIRHIYLLLADLPGVARDKRQPLQELMTALPIFGSARPVTITTSPPPPQSCTTVDFTKCSYSTKEFMCTFNVDPITRNNQRKCKALRTIANARARSHSK